MAREDFNPDYLLPGTRIGGYVVQGMLGQGGSASVYEVESAEGHRFALKLCRYHGGAAYRTAEWRVDQRYSRSVTCLQLLKGQRNVAELYAHDRVHGHQYLVQELVPGSLKVTSWVKRESPTLRKLVGAFVELAELCGVMAGLGICHRDLKPANILVTPEGTPKVIDFESATCPHAKPVTRREAGEVPGTRGWQCPELCQAILEEKSKKKNKEAFDFRPWGDLFSLGVVLYECLTGEHPYDTTLPGDMLLAEIAFETPLHPMRLSTGVPLGLNKVVMRLLEKQPEARYRDGAEVANDLRKLLENVKDERWDKPFKHPVPYGELAPVLPLVAVLVPPETPVPINEKESEGPVPDTPPSEPSSGDDEKSPDEAARQDASSPPAVDPDEVDTDEPHWTPESEPAVGTVLDFGKGGAYTLEQRLGRGGMGEVYLARQVGAAGFVQLVAVKRVRPGRRGPWEECHFVDEARILSRLRHENIARVYGFHEWQGSFYLVMEYIEGSSLHALLELARRKRHRFSESVACAIMAGVADALDYAHQAKDDAGQPLHIVHRDVSPTNILIAQTGRVVLVDFGVAYNTQEGRIPTGAGSTTIKGKWPYVSPEQVKRQPLDGRSDLFSVGTILMELLIGEPPFGWAGDNGTLLRIGKVAPEYVASRLVGVSRPLRAICQKLLALHPDGRFATAGEAATALRRHARLYEGQQSIRAEVGRLQALPDTKAPPAAAVAATRALSRVRRARRAVTLAGAAMLATLAFVSWYVPRPAAVPAPAPPLLEESGPAVSLLPPEKSIAPATPVPPPNGPLVGKPTEEDGATVAAGPAHRRKIAAIAPPSEPATAAERHAAPTADLSDNEAPLIVTTPPAERRTDVESASQGQLAAMTASYVRVSGEVLSPEHALAELFATGNAALTHFVKASRRRFTVNGVSAYVEVWIPRDDDDPGASTVAVLVDLNNPDDAPWEPSEGRIFRDARLSMARPAAIQVMPRVIPPGQRGRVAIVFDRSIVAEKAMPIFVEIFRDSRPEIGMEVSSKDLEQRKSTWPF